MTRVVVIGEHGEVTQTVRVGPAVLERCQEWNDLPRLTAMVRDAGVDVVALEPTESAASVAEPDCWLLSDIPFAAAVASSLYRRLTEPAREAGLLMIGGALSLAGQQGVGGWAGADQARLLPVIVSREDDALETPGGLDIAPTDDCPASLRDALTGTPVVYGYNKVVARRDASVLARFGSGDPAIVLGSHGPSLVFASDLLPHWGPDFAGWAGLPRFVRALVDLVTPQERREHGERS